MPTTTLQRFVRFDPAEIDARDPLDSGMCGRALSNLNHLADQYAQHRINWNLGTLRVTYAPVPAVGDWGLVWCSTPFDLHVRSNEESYRMRLRLLVSSDSASHGAIFRGVVTPHEFAISERDFAGVNTGDVSITSTSYSWLEPSALLYLRPEQVDRAEDTASALDSIGGVSTTARWLRCVLMVWGKVTNVAAEPALRGVHLSEVHP
jgi:hypothetical protein